MIDRMKSTGAPLGMMVRHAAGIASTILFFAVISYLVSWILGLFLR